MSEIQARLLHLEASGLISIAKLLPELEYLFRHALVQDAAYDSLLRQDRRKLHRAVGEALEAAYPERLDDLAPTLATHFREADHRTKAIDYFYLAGERARSRYANQEAEMHYRAGLELVSEPADRARLMAGLGEALVGQSRMHEAIQIWSEAITLYRELGDHNNVALIYSRSARASWWAGDSHGSQELCEQAFSVVPADLESSGMAALLHEAARSSYFLGQAEDSLAYCQKALAMAEHLKHASVEADSLITLALLQKGQAAADSLERAVAVAEANGLLAAATRAHHNLGLSLMFQRTPQEGLPHLRRAAELAEQRGMVADQLYSLGVVLGLVTALGDTPMMWETRHKMEALLSQIEHDSTASLTAKSQIATMMFHLGEFEEARQRYLECRASAKQSRDVFGLHGDCNQLAENALQMGNYDEALMFIDEAFSLRLIDPMETAVTHYLACILKLRDGDLEGAREHLQKIEDLYTSTSNFRVGSLRDLVKLRIAASEGRWDEAQHIRDSVDESLQRRDTKTIRNRRLLDWAEILFEADPVGNQQRVLELLTEAKAAYEAMQAPAYVQRIEARIAEIKETAH